MTPVAFSSGQSLREELIQKVRGYASDSDLELIERACSFAAQHAGSPAAAKDHPEAASAALDHSLHVALILAEMKVDLMTIVAGLLHVLAEHDGKSLLTDIERGFGKAVRFLVENTANVARMEFQMDEADQVENFRKMLLAMSRDIRVIMIRFADQLQVMRTLQTYGGFDRYRMARETLDIYAPLANRLGIGWLKIEFEDLAFQHLLPREFQELEQKVAMRRKDQEGYISEVVATVRQALESQSIKADISSRVKHFYGIWQKLRRQNIPFEKIYDVMGIRIITETQGDCYAALGLIHGLYTPVPGRLKDFIGAPKSNGYQSLQTTVVTPGGPKVEFQIRTHDMNRVAEQGVAAHWSYKESQPLHEKDRAVFDSLRTMISGHQDIQDSKDFLDSVKGDLFSHVVYVFTPGGDLKELPSGSTPIDFAYAVHSEVGNRCTGARVNGRIVPLRHVLQNGDTIEVITSPNHGPSRDWLKIAVTTKAKNRIRAWIRNEERTQSIEIGLGLIEEELRKHNRATKLAKSEKMAAVAEQLGYPTVEDLLIAVGYGKTSPRQAVNRLIPDLTREKPQQEGAEKPDVKERERKGIQIRGVDHLLYHFSKCCYPVPGDDVVGFVSRGKGVAVHTRDCENLNVLAVDRDRLIDVQWEPQGDQTHPVRVEITARDKPGLLAAISSVLSTAKVNVSRLEVGTTRSDLTAFFHFILDVRSRDHLDEVMRKLYQVSGVQTVRRRGSV